MAVSSLPLLLPTREEEIDRGKQLAEVAIKTGPGRILYSQQNERQEKKLVAHEQMSMTLSEPSPASPSERSSS